MLMEATAAQVQTMRVCPSLRPSVCSTKPREDSRMLQASPRGAASTVVVLAATKPTRQLVPDSPKHMPACAVQRLSQTRHPGTRVASRGEARASLSDAGLDRVDLLWLGRGAAGLLSACLGQTGCGGCCMRLELDSVRWVLLGQSGVACAGCTLGSSDASANSVSAGVEEGTSFDNLTP